MLETRTLKQKTCQAWKSSTGEMIQENGAEKIVQAD